jgi:hypothetical protein
VVGNPSGYVRHDGFNAVVFRGSDGNVWELSLGNGWSAGNLATLTGAPAALGDPVPYVRADATSGVVYRGNTNGSGSDIIELRLTDSWQAALDLMVVSDWSFIYSAATDPMPYVRLDGINSIVFSDLNNALREITNASGWSEQAWMLSNTAGESP